MKLVLQDDQQATLTIEPKDSQGNAAIVDGVPNWKSTDPAICTVEPAADGLSATVKTVGPVGTCSIKVDADADLGEGIRTIEGSLDVEVTAGEAGSLGISASNVGPRV